MADASPATASLPTSPASPPSPSPAASKPAATEKLAPTATVAPEASINPVGGDDSLLEASFTKKDTAPVAPKPDATKPDDKTKPADKPEVKADEKGVKTDEKGKIIEEKKVEEKKADEPREHFPDNKSMRAELDRRKQVITSKDQEVNKLTAELTTLRTKVEDLSKNGGGDAKVLAEQLGASQKQIEELRARLSEYDYRNDAEYEQKFTQPWNRAAKRALDVVSKLRITDTDGTPTEQTATAAHLERLLALDEVAALEQSEVWFGKHAPLAMRHWGELKRLQEESEEAVRTHKATHGEKTKAEQAKKTQEQQFANEAYQKVSQDLMDARPDLFKPAADDADHATVLEQAISTIDASLTNRAQMPLEKRVRFDALVRNHLIASVIKDKLMIRSEEKIKAGEARIAELEKTIAELRGSGPGPAKDITGGEGGGDKGELVGGNDEDLRKAFSK